MPQVSVIIPVYNVQEHLPECLQSIQQQSLTDFEAILVDDGSTDQSGEICDGMAARDDRFRVIHQENQGVSAARNQGVALASAPYITFCDGDDRLVFQALEKLLQAQREHRADLVVCGIQRFSDEGKVEPIAQHGTKEYATIKEFAQHWCQYDRADVNGPCNKLYRRDIFEKGQVFFPTEMNLGEDLLMNLSYLKEIQRVVFIPDILYEYRKVAGSLSRKVRLNKYKNDQILFGKIYAFLKAVNADTAENKQCLAYQYATGGFKSLENIAVFSKQRKEAKREIAAILDQEDFQRALRYTKPGSKAAKITFFLCKKKSVGCLYHFLRAKAFMKRRIK